MAWRAKFSDFDGAGKIFVGGLSKETTMDSLKVHFEQYGKIVDHVVITDQITKKSRGFGFVTYDDPLVVNKIFELNHVIDGKQVELKRTIPRDSGYSKDFKTKKIFVGGVPATVSDDELRNFFSKFGKVLEHEIIRDRDTNKSRGFGFVVFDTEKVVDDLLSNGNKIDFASVQVEIKKAEPKKPNPPEYSGHPRSRFHNDSIRRYGESYNGYGDAGGYGPSSYRSFDGRGSTRFDGYGGYDAQEMGSGYGGLSSYAGSYDSSRLSSYGGSYDSGPAGAYGGGNFGGGFSREEGFGTYGPSRYGGSYSSGPGSTYGQGSSNGKDGIYGSGRGGQGSSYGYDSGRAGYSGGRYHPYGR